MIQIEAAAFGILPGQEIGAQLAKLTCALQEAEPGTRVVTDRAATAAAWIEPIRKATDDLTVTGNTFTCGKPIRTKDCNHVHFAP